MKKKMKKKPKILIFGDEGIFIDRYIPEFVELGFNVRIYENYNDLVEKVIKGKPDIIFCASIASGEIDILDAIKILNNNEKVKRIPVVMLINLDKEEDIKKGIDLTFRKYFTREEYRPREIARGVQEYLIKTGRFTKKDFV